MKTFVALAPVAILVTLINLFLLGGIIYLFILLAKALKRYIKSGDVRKEKSRTAKSLGAALKEHRTRCKMTQEFVAEYLGVSRQAVSKWESGASDPTTANLLALAKLYNIKAEDLLHSIIQ